MKYFCKKSILDHNIMHHTCITPILANKHDKWVHIGWIYRHVTMADFGGFLMSDFGFKKIPENRPNREPITTEKPFVAILLNLIALLTGLIGNRLAPRRSSSHLLEHRSCQVMRKNGGGRRMNTSSYCQLMVLHYQTHLYCKGGWRRRMHWTSGHPPLCMR